MLDITVIIRSRNAQGAWFIESPAPIVVTTAIFLTSFAFIASMMFAVPSCSIVFPTSLVLPPSATTTPVTPLPSKTFITSSLLVTLPLKTVSLSSLRGVPPLSPPLPSGMFIFDGSRARHVTSSPRASAWYTASLPVPPVAPKTAMLHSMRAERAGQGVDETRLAVAKVDADGLEAEKAASASSVKRSDLNAFNGWGTVSTVSSDFSD
mmetsp:Transcript_114350/g.198226  ORF Transcript_114350/g.198226 Transcript_114350/m.198226 type:complete len:208 (-) Transcript_114350:79-702(-)